MADPTPAPLHERLADAFIVLLQTRLTTDEVKLIQCGDADPDDFCDANMVMDEAFTDVMGRSTYMPSDWEEGRCTEAQHDADLALWNQAVGAAKAREYSLDGIDMSNVTASGDNSTSDEAVYHAETLLQDLIHLNRKATALQSLVLLPLIADARRVHDQLRALIAATSEAN